MTPQPFVPPTMNQPHNMDPKQGHILHMKIHCGRNLPKADTFGTIDAYAVVHIPLLNTNDVGSLSRAIHKTKIIPNQVDPVWKFRIYQHDVDLSKNIEIQIFDHDSLSENDLVATCEIPLSGQLLASGPIYKKEFVLNTVGKYKPYRSGSSSSIVVSLGIGSSHETVCTKLMTSFPSSVIHQDVMKKNIVFPLGFSNLCMKISMKKHLKISVLDCNPTRNLVVHFEIPGRDFRSKMTFHQTPKTKECSGISSV
nr:unnamed protein product [Naegleria fowleri]